MRLVLLGSEVGQRKDRRVATDAEVTVDATSSLGTIPRIWASIGYDELNWTATPRGKAIHRLLGEDVLRAGPYWVRMHNTFTSGTGWSAPAWGAGNPYHEAPDGTARYHWPTLDAAYDAITTPGGLPLVELGFMPRDLSRAAVADATFGGAHDLGREPYELEAWKQPPKDLDRWRELVHAFVAHAVERYGADQVAHWRFELWNEPDIANYWHGTVEEYLALYDASYDGAKRAFPQAQVGGPGTTDRGEAFLERFLAHTAGSQRRPDFLSFHTKGAYFTPRRIYDPFAEAAQESPSTSKMLGDIRKNVAVIERFPEFADLPVYIDECDPAVGTIYGVYDNPNFVVTNSEHYPSFVCQLVGALLAREPRVTLITQWAFYFEGKRWFEGNRTLVDNENVEKPILNGLRMLERLAGGERLAVTSDSTGVGGIAVRQGERLRLLLWHHVDPWWEEGGAEVTVRLAGWAGSTARLWRLDREHANTFRAWQAMGGPDDPSTAELERIRAAGQLTEDPIAIQPTGSDSHLSLTIPLHGLALIEIG